MTAESAPAGVRRVAQIVRVTDAARRPRAGIRLAVLSAQGPVPELGYVTGEDGSARIGLPPGPATLEAIDPEGDRQLFEIEAGQSQGSVCELRMGRDGQ